MRGPYTNTTLSIKIDPERKKVIKQFCSGKGFSMTAAVHEAMDRFIVNNGTIKTAPIPFPKHTAKNAIEELVEMVREIRENR